MTIKLEAAYYKKAFLTRVGLEWIPQVIRFEKLLPLRSSLNRALYTVRWLQRLRQPQVTTLIFDSIFRRRFLRR